MRGIRVPAGLIIDDPQAFRPRRTVYIESVDLTAGLNRSDTRYFHREIALLLQQIYLQSDFGILPIALQDIAYVTLDDDVLTYVFVRIVHFFFLFLHRLVRRHKSFLQFGLIGTDRFDFIGLNPGRMRVVTMQKMRVYILHRVMDEGT